MNDPTIVIIKIYSSQILTFQIFKSHFSEAFLKPISSKKVLSLSKEKKADLFFCNIMKSDKSKKTKKNCVPKKYFLQHAIIRGRKSQLKSKSCGSFLSVRY